MAKKYEKLTFTDDFMFCKILEDNPKLCKELLELILGKKLGSLAYINRQKPIEITADGKGVRFDIYAEEDETGKGAVYDVEMQNAKKDSLPKRSRYSQSMIDLDLMDRGKKYEELNKSFVIYICNFNLWPNIGRHKYTFASLCREDPSIELKDGAEKIFLCAKGKKDDVSEDMKAFLNYIAKGKPENAFTNELENAVSEAKLHKRWRKEYMTLLEHYEQEREEGRKEGRKEGREEERKNTERERKNAERERKNAERERKNAENERKKAERERRRAEAAEQKIRELEKILAKKAKHKTI